MAGAITARRPYRTRSGSRGFTLLEIVIALAVMSVLLTMAVPVLQVQAQRQRESELRAALRDIRSAIDAYKRAADEGRIARATDASGYPPSLDALVQGVPDLRDPAKRPIYFLRRLPARSDAQVGGCCQRQSKAGACAATPARRRSRARATTCSMSIRVPSG
jgi:general secretion pathway protein G